MTATKTTDLAALTSVDAAADFLFIVDTSDTSMAASGTTKKLLPSNLPISTAMQTALDAKISKIADPNADRILFWDDSAGDYAYLTAGSGLSISGTTITASGSNPTECMIIPVGDETTSITTGTAKVTFRMPYAFTLTAVRASLTTASSSGLPTVDINENGTTILSTKLTIDANEKTSTTAATAAVISDSSLADDAEITIDIDVAGTGAQGLKVTLIGSRT